MIYCNWNLLRNIIFSNYDFHCRKMTWTLPNNDFLSTQYITVRHHPHPQNVIRNRWFAAGGFDGGGQLAAIVRAVDKSKASDT